ncbi:MAG: hypothetical protein R3246_07800, partial [Acidimicrobiia bacterium]|nr:hypothetical protein [Acidimicrobiia bacterium]
LTTVLVLGITPTGLDGVSSPLIGLADAVAEAPERSGVVARHWYSKAVSRELITETLADGRVIEFLVNATEERWHDAGDTPRLTVTYGNPVFFSPEDEDAFFQSGLSARYGPGRTVTVSNAVDQFLFAKHLEEAKPEVLSGLLRRRVAGLGDQRMEEVRLLQLAAELISLHADDPLMRAQTLRAIADIPGISVLASDRNVVVSIDYVDGDRPLRLMYEFDGDTAHLVGEYLAALATQSEPATVLRAARHSLPSPAGPNSSTGS